MIALGYGLGPWFATAMAPALRQRYLLRAGLGALLGFVVLRAANGYGEQPWHAYDSGVLTLMSFFTSPRSAVAAVPRVDAGHWPVIAAGA